MRYCLDNSDKPFLRIHRIFFILFFLIPLLAVSAPSQYNIVPVTSDNIDHKWPSINNNGDIVWSVKDTNNFWQVVKCIPLNHLCDTSNTTLITSGNQNHERPVISDDGTIAWFQDNSGGGVGYQIIRRDPSGQQSVVEFSSRNNLTGEQRVAGKYIGIASNGNTISYYNFFGLAGTTRRMNVSGFGRLNGDFFGYNQPDINNDGILSLVYVGQFDNSPTFGTIYKATVSNPAGLVRVDTGQIARMTNGVNPEIVYVKNNIAISTKTGNIYSTRLSFRL